MFNHIDGDLFSTPDKIIVHGCNNKGVMGSGVAKIIRDQYPKAYEDYKETSNLGYNKYNRDIPLGSIIPVFTNNKHIINAITQDGYGRDGKMYVSYDAIDSCMVEIAYYAHSKRLIDISMPRIGAGLGGGKWEVIEEIIKHRLIRFNVNVYTI